MNNLLKDTIPNLRISTRQVTDEIKPDNYTRGNVIQQTIGKLSYNNSIFLISVENRFEIIFLAITG
jgi:hypothetical protein